MIRCVFWYEPAQTDIIVIFKRAVIVLSSSKWVYIRLATEKKVSLRQQITFVFVFVLRFLAWDPFAKP